MKQLSIGLPSTLGSYLKMTDIFFGESSAQSKFIQSKIDESPSKEDEEVIADESQMIYLLGSLK